MRFGVREICDVVLRAKAKQKLGSRTFYKNEPVLYFDTLKTSSLEGASTTVYAQGGPGNPRLIAWEGERTLTFTMEDALLSAESFAILSGAGLIAATQEKPIYVHTTAQVQAIANNTLIVEDLVCWNNARRADAINPISEEYTHKEADIFCMRLDEHGEVADEPCVPAKIVHQVNGTTVITCAAGAGVKKDDVVLVDYYVKKTGNAQMIEITADKFGGNYYLEASTLFRREADGVDMPAEFIIPNCKVQSNFTFSMASSGDPSTFTFTIDAFPDYTKFDKTHKILAGIQIIEDNNDGAIEEFRDPTACATSVEFGVAARAADVAIINDNTIAIIGDDIPNDSYDSEVFGTLAEGTQVNIQLPTTDGDSLTKNYKVIQYNPGLVYFSGNGVVGTVKTKEYSKTELDEGYAFLATNKPGDIKIEFYKDNNLVKTYTFKNKVTFAE